MVLFKRKPVQFLMVPDIQDDHVEVWTIPQTGEIFTTYEDYLNRMDFYKQRRFICQISGKSGLTFFDALKSEFAGAAEVEQAFPEALKGPVLRKVQFQTISRIDALVDQIYDEFKNDFYPGEAVMITTSAGERLHGVVRDKTRFGSKVLPDGTLTLPYSRYTVSVDERPNEEVVVDDSQIFRDRKVFTKLVLRSFIRKTVTRDAWNGAPWLVNPDIAEYYKIDTRVPPHLRYDSKLLERKQLQAQKRLSQPDANGFSASFSTNGPVRLPELKPAPKSHKAKHGPQHDGHGAVPGKGKNSLGYDDPYAFKYPLLINQGPPGSYMQQPVYTQPEPPPPPPPPPKYPIEDLQVEPRDRVRPKLRYLCHDPPVKVEDKSSVHDKIHMRSIGPLLETWDTLNVYCEVFKLDSFTFDDFVEAMLVASGEVPCQLFDEIHCAVLKILVSSEEDGGKVQIQLPELEDDDEEEESVQESVPPSPEPEPEPSGRTTRRSLAKLEAERLAAEAAAAEKAMQQAEDAPKHRAEEVLKDFDWIEQLRKRNFHDGGWQLIMVGLLHQLSKNERKKAVCDELLQQLVPRDVEATPETVKQHYDRLDINYRVQALQIICMLTVETKAVRGYMEDCSETMTGYRKDKIEWQRKRKQALEELKALNEERKILLPDNLPPSPPQEPTKTADNDVKMSDAEDLAADNSEDGVVDTDDDVHTGGRSLRRAQDRAAERKRKLEQVQERKEKAEAAAKIPKQSKQFLKLLKDIQKKEDEIKKCEEEIAVIDNDLREADCPRTRVLGKDRFCNRYYWFERNGMPYGGLPNSSTAVAGYANGCIWVQGPDELERQGFIDLSDKLQNEYKAKFNLTVPERKLREEGPTHVFDAWQWGYFSEPDEVDRLIDWLDPRGVLELKLRKEIVSYRDKIIKNMENRKEYLREPEPQAAAPKAETSPQPQEQEPTSSPPTKKPGKSAKRMSTRGNRPTAATTPATPEPPAATTPSFRCLAWKNTTAMEDLGHLHNQQPPPPPPRRSKKKSRESAASEVAAAPEPVTTRGKSAKAAGRQGTRY